MRCFVGVGGLTRRICRVLISRPHGKSGSTATQDVKRNYTGRQIYCGQPKQEQEVARVGPVGGCHGDGGGGVGVCALTLGPVGIPPFKQWSEGLMKCEIKLIRRCFVPPHHFITTEMEPTAKGSPVIQRYTAQPTLSVLTIYPPQQCLCHHQRLAHEIRFKLIIM